tara:strand:- start:78 stop:1004 length:927 start_codon:yes stop_codon:yes gene_type:complete
LEYTKQTTAEEVLQGLDLTGQVALVTGCTNGIGYETMRVLAQQGAHVLATGRTLEKMQGAAAGLRGQITPLALELTDLASVRRCAQEVAHRGLVPDIVICNAGIDNFGGIEFIAGIEKVFFANFLGHFVLVNQVLPGMVARGSGRVVHVSSNAAYLRGSKGVPGAGIDFDNLRGEGVFSAPQAYARSKLANALFSLALANRLKHSGVTSNALHPGSIYTNIAHSAPLEMREAIKRWAPKLLTPAQGATTQVYVATHPDLARVSGQFFEVCKPVEVEHPHFLNDLEMAERLWQEADAMVSQVANHMPGG